MKLLTNEKNPEAAKILLAGEFSQKKIEILIITDYHDIPYPKRIPQLVLDSGIHLFSSNAASKYLFAPTNNEAEINYYLDYEANVIQPLIFTFSGKMDSKLHSNLENILDKLNKTLTGQDYLVLNSISVADISVWTTLYPFAVDSKYFKEYFSSRNSLRNWFEKILKLPEVINVLEQYPLNNNISSLMNICSVHWFPNTSVSKISSESDKINIQDFDEDDHLKDSDSKLTKEEIDAAKESWINKSKRKLPKPAVNPVLPVPGEKNILITSALPYVNNVPHLGNLIGCVLSGDVFARFCRLRNYNTLYICGTDEYGTATETKALEEGLTPKEICDKYFQVHDSIYKWFNINFDRFGRTTTPEQTEICQDIFLKVKKNGYILSNSVEQLLCENCDRYLADRFVEGICPKCAYEDARGDQCDLCGHLINATELIKPRCKICQQTPVHRYSDQFFLDLPKIEPELRKWIGKSCDSWSHNAREITKAWLSDGLKPRCITRDLKWGIPIPVEGYESKVFYVWFDAPIGYISITKQYTQHWKKWWMPDEDVEINLCQFIGKDNVPFHSVMFPSSLLGTHEKFVLVDSIFATEYLNYEDGKFSKSRGVGVFGSDAKDTGIPADIWRFYLLYVRPETQDSSFSWHDLAMKNNSELLNNLGNFINRALVFAEKNYESEVPPMNLTEEDFELLAMVNRELKAYISALEKGKLREGIRRILSIARLGNQLMQMSQPWVLSKGTAEAQIRAKTVIGLSINLSCFLSILMSPYMPETSEIIQKQLNAKPDVNIIDDEFYCILEGGHKIGKPFPLFDKLEMTHIEELKSRFAGKQKSKISDRKETKSSSTIDADARNDVASLEAAVAAQGDRVRQMKAEGGEKSEWQPEVAVLLDLKKKLEMAKSNLQNCAAQDSGTINEKNISELEKAIEQQGGVVRKLKESGVERSEWQPELNKLLELKKQLAMLKGDPLPSAKNTTEKKQKKK